MRAGSLPFDRAASSQRIGAARKPLATRFQLPLLLAVPVAASIGLLVIPLLVLVRFSFLLNIPGRGLSDQTTLANYTAFATDDFYRGSIGVTLITAIVVTLICLVLAFPVAYAYARTSFGPKGLLLIAILSPFYIDILVRIYAWMVLLGRNGLVDRLLRATGVFTSPVDLRSSYVGILIILVYVTLPFMILSLIGPLQNIDENLVHAAQICGATPVRVFRTMILPLSIPGVVAGSILSFSVGISAFVVPLLVGGKIGQQFLAVVIYSSMNQFQDWGLGGAAAMILLIASLGVVLAYNWMMRSLRIGVILADEPTA